MKRTQLSVDPIDIPQTISKLESGKYSFSDCANLLHNLSLNLKNDLKENPVEFKKRVNLSFTKIKDLLNSSKRDELFNEWLLSSQKLPYSRCLSGSYLIINVGNLSTYSDHSFSADQINFLLKKLTDLVLSNEKNKMKKQGEEKLAHTISLAIHRLSKLIPQKKLIGKIDASHINFLLATIKMLSSHPNNIGMVTYALGELAGQLDNKISAENIISLLIKLNKLPENEINCQHIGNTLYGVGELAKADRLEGNISATHIEALLLKLNNLSTDKVFVQDITMSFYGLGELTKAGQLEGNISATHIEALLIKLNNMSDNNIDGQSISNTLYGIGELATADRLEGNISATHIEALLIKLNNMSDNNIDGQGISSTLYGISKLAKAGRLEGNISAASIDPLLLKLNNLSDHTIISQNISNTLYSIGELAKAARLEGNISAASIDPLLLKLNNMSDNNSTVSQSISNTLYGIGELAKADRLEGNISAPSIDPLLIKLSNQSDNNIIGQNISNTLYGIYELAEAGRLEGNINFTHIDHLLLKLSNLSDNNIDGQNIANTLYAIGELAKAGRLEGNISATHIEALLLKLNNMPNNKIDGQNISNILYGIGELAKVGRLEGSISAASIDPLLLKLNNLSDNNIISQNISNSLYSIGELAKAGQLEGNISAARIEVLLIKLNTLPIHEINGQAVTMSIYGLRELANAGRLAGTNNLNQNLLLTQLINKINPSLFEIKLILKSVILLKEKQMVQIESQVITKLLTSVNHQFNAASSKGMINADLILTCWKAMDCFIPSNEGSMELFTPFMQSLLDLPYLSPLLAAQMVHILAKLKGNTKRDTKLLDQVFMHCIKAMQVVRLKRLDPTLVQTLRNDVALLANTPWQAILQQVFEKDKVVPTPRANNQPIAHKTNPSSNVVPTSINKLASSNKSQTSVRSQTNLAPITQSTTRRTGSQHPIALYIENNQLNELRRFLNLANADLPHTINSTGNRPSSSRNAGRSLINQLINNVNNAWGEGGRGAADHSETTVYQFLSTSQHELSSLILTRPNADFYTSLLQACPGKTRNKIARENLLHPFITQLPINELDSLIETLISPFQIYRDKGALSAIFNSLTIRFDQVDTEEQQLIWDLHMKLANRALKFHSDCERHPHMVSYLQQVIRGLETNTVIMLEEEVEEENDYQPSLNIPTSVLSQTSAKMIAHTAPLLQPTPTIPTSAPAPAVPASIPNVNEEYLYTTEDIQSILGARLQHAHNRGLQDNVTILASAYHSNDNKIAGNKVVDVLGSFIKSEDFALNPPDTILIPLNLGGGHWTGVKVVIKDYQIDEIKYFDSISSKQDVAQMKIIQNDLLKAGLINQHIFVIKDMSGLLQTDTTNCGPLLIENFYCNLMNKHHNENGDRTTTPTLIKTIRSTHLANLKTYRKDYYDDSYDNNHRKILGFNNRQRLNVNNVAPLQDQYRSHGLFPHPIQPTLKSQSQLTKNKTHTNNKQELPVSKKRTEPSNDTLIQPKPKIKFIFSKEGELKKELQVEAEKLKANTQRTTTNEPVFPNLKKHRAK